jgi:hypothetical protein
LPAVTPDAFSTETLAALYRARNAAGEIGKSDVVLYDDADPRMPEIKKLLDAANDAVDEVLAKGARVHLLFGDQSPAGVAATGIGAQLRNVCSALEHQPDSIRGGVAMGIYSKNFGGTLDYHQRFNRAALAVLQQTWWDRLVKRSRVAKIP